jgi:hypothetical protein
MENFTRNVNELGLAQEFAKKTQFSSIKEFASLFSISALEKNIKYVVSQRNTKSIS